jgi:hypothetical protein
MEARLGTTIAGTQAAIGSGNTPTVAWFTRMASRSGSPISFRLLRGLAMPQRVNRSAPTALFHVAGLQNILADVASRPVTGVASRYHLYERDPNAMCPQSFLTHFNTSYPLPQQQPWLSVQPPSALWLKVISTLRGQRLELLRRWMMPGEELVGAIGPHTPANVESTRGSVNSPELKNNRTSLPLPPGFELASSGVQSKLATKVWKTLSVTWTNPRHGRIRPPTTKPRNKRLRFTILLFKLKEDPGPGTQATSGPASQRSS